nr:hypothetical protein [Tanacetum cinerariifolium]
MQGSKEEQEHRTYKEECGSRNNICKCFGAYKASLESIEARLDVYKKNESIFEEDIKILKLDIMFRDNELTELRKKFEKDEKERDNLKLTLEKFENLSKNLSKLLDNQVCDKYKTGVGYDSQVFDNQVFDSKVKDKYKIAEGYHAVPPPYIENFMPPKPNLILVDVDEYVVSESVTSVPTVAINEAKTSESKPKSRKPSFAKVEFVKPNEQVKSLKESIKHEEHNRSYLFEYEEIDGGYVAFGGDPKGGKITGKGKSVQGEEKKDAKDLRNEDNKVLSTEEPRVNQEKNANVNSTNILNTVSLIVNAASKEINIVGKKSSIELSNDPNMPNLEEIVYSDDDDEVVEQIIVDIHSAPQTRRMTKNVTNHDGCESAFLYGKIEEEVYVCQPLGFEDPEFPDRVYKIDKTLFIKKVKGDILLVQIYVDDIIFGSTRKEICNEFEKMMHKKFQMSSIRELTFFLGLQVTQKDDGIFISREKYVDEILKKFGFSTVKTASTHMETSMSLMKDDNAKDVDVHLYRLMIGSLMYLTSSRLDIMFVDAPFDLGAYTDSDYAGASLDRKSTTEGVMDPKSNVGLWIQFHEYQDAIDLSKNPMQHCRTKHIKIRHHFLSDNVQKGHILIEKVSSIDNIINILTKPLKRELFNYLRLSLGMMEHIP